MSETGSSSPVDNPDGSTNGEIILNSEQLFSPQANLQKIDDLLNSPDELGRTLPEVEYITYQPDEFEGGRITTSRIVEPNGGLITLGEQEVLTDNVSGTEYFSSIWANQGKGIGMRMYLEAIKAAIQRGHDFRTDTSLQSEEAVKVWQKLRDKGLAQVVEEFKYDQDIGDYRGYYVVNGNNLPKRIPIRNEEPIIIDENDLTEV